MASDTTGQIHGTFMLSYTVGDVYTMDAVLLYNGQVLDSKTFTLEITSSQPTGPEVVSEDIENGGLYNNDYFNTPREFEVVNLQSGDEITLETNAQLALDEVGPALYQISGVNNTGNLESVSIVLNGSTVLCEFYVMGTATPDYTISWYTTGGYNYPLYRRERNQFAIMGSIYDSNNENKTQEINDDNGIFLTVHDPNANTDIISDWATVIGTTNPAFNGASISSAVQDYITNNSLTDSQISDLIVKVSFEVDSTPYELQGNVNYYAN